MSEAIVNKVAESGLITLDLEQYMPKEEILAFDLKDFLFMGLILKEKDFRAALVEHDWTKYQDKNVAVFCSADAIVPNWAYMLVVSYMQPYASFIFPGTVDETVKAKILQTINAVDKEQFRDQRVVVKGCGDVEINAYAYLQITILLKPLVKTLMYGEPCSTVPVYKRK